MRALWTETLAIAFSTFSLAIIVFFVRLLWRLELVTSTGPPSSSSSFPGHCLAPFSGTKTSTSGFHSSVFPRDLLSHSFLGTQGFDYTLKDHVEPHTTGLLEGQAPDQCLTESSLHLCHICSGPISTRTRPCCPRYHPAFNNPVTQFFERPLQPETLHLDEVLSSRVPTHPESRLGDTGPLLASRLDQCHCQQ